MNSVRYREYSVNVIQSNMSDWSTSDDESYKYSRPRHSGPMYVTVGQTLK